MVFKSGATVAISQVVRPASPASSESSLASSTDLTTPPNEVDEDTGKILLPVSMADADELSTLLERRSAYPKEFPSLPGANSGKVSSDLYKGTADSWVKRDERLIPLTGKHPFNSEVPVHTLFDAGFLTPTELFYTRSHGAVPKIEGEVLQNWSLSITGLVENELKFSMQDLKTKFETVSLPITLVCAGNRRREQNVVKKGLGFNWGAAAVSTGLFTGVYLADILAAAKPKVNPRIGHAIFEGYDFDLPQGPYGTSQQLNHATDRRYGIIIAWALNGLPLEPDHGFPLRIVCPGVVGGRSVKWLHKIEIADHQSTHHLHIYDNKVLPTQLSPEQARAETHWWYDPKYEIKDLNVNSAIARPAHNEVVSLSSSETFTCKGYAYAGGGRRVCRVEVSIDEGETWSLAKINYFEDQFRELAYRDKTFGTIDLTSSDRCYAWCFWDFEFPMQKLKEIGSIQVRAMDEALSVQQRDMYWNPTSMMNNWWFRTAVIQEDNGTIRFEHPTIAGNATGGWMQRLKEEGQDILHPVFKPKSAEVETKAVVPAKPAAAAKSARFQWIKPEVNRIITLAELKAHNTPEEPWFVVHGEVYDGTGFLNAHPGGSDSITIVAGEDATEDFMAIHSTDALRQLVDYHIGTLEGSALPAIESPATSAQAEPAEDEQFLVKNKWKGAKLISIKRVNHDSCVYRFALDRPDQPLGLPTGQHVYVRLRRKPRAASRIPGTDVDCTVIEGGDLVQRAYTPVSMPGAIGFIDLLVKLYLPTAAHPDGGKFTCALNEVKVGETVEFKGPIGELIWAGHGVARWKHVDHKVRNIGMIAAGSGITPILQVLRGIFLDQEDTETNVWVLDANKTEQDILCRKELEAFLFASRGRMRLHYTLSPAVPRGSRLHRVVKRVSSRYLKPSASSSNWEYSRGHIDVPMMRQHLPPAAADSLILICGPDGLVNNTAKPGLAQLGWDVEKQVVVF